MLKSIHQDNPRLYDGEKWTKEGVEYLDKLRALTGPRRRRLLDGEWTQAEGVVFESWSSSLAADRTWTNLIDRFPIPIAWPRHLSVDFGYKNPFVCQWWAEDPEGRLYRYREIYKTGVIVEEHARKIAKLCENEPRPRQVITDHDAEDRATLEKHLKIPTTAAFKDVSPGIQEVESRLRPDKDGKPRIFLLRDSLVERDRELADAAKPCCTEEEFDGYIWESGGGRRKGEDPVKVNDHGIDALRYLVATLAHKPKGRWANASSSTSTGQRSILDELPEGVFGAV